MIDELLYDGQFSLFDAPKLRITKPVRLIELFSGIGSQAKALQRLGVPFESWGAYDIDRYAVSAYNAIFGTAYEPTDICNLHAEDLRIEDTDKYTYILTYSFPCFVGDTMVLTKDGFKEIENIKVGDYVLTHNRRYRKVVDSKMVGVKKTMILNTMCSGEVVSTENHRFFVRHMSRAWNSQLRRYERKFGDPTWKPCKDLTRQDYVGVAINRENTIPSWNGVTYHWSDGRKARVKNTLQPLMSNEAFWWVVGRYIGDGWHRSQGGIIVCTAKNELHEVTDVLESINVSYSVVEERTVYKIHIPSKEWEAFLTPFGRGAANKRIPGFVFDLPRNLCESLVCGYVSADGSHKDGLYQITTVSRELAYGIGQLVAKAYETPYRIYLHRGNNTHQIEDRIVKQRPVYQVKWKLQSSKQDKAFFENGYVWCPIRNIAASVEAEVYDITVEDDHSFTANGIIAHNCQDLSIAGHQKGMAKGSGTRSGLLWEVERLLKECNGNLPQILLMENVKQVINHKNKPDFDSWRESLAEMGYTSAYQVMNAKDYGVAQNRERCFMVSWLGDYTYEFPKPIPLVKRLRDYLEDEVDEKYYLSEEQIATFVARSEEHKRNGNGFRFEPIDVSDTHTTAHTIREKYRSQEDNYVYEGGGACEVIGTVGVKEGKEEYANNRVYGKDGCSPTILARDWKDPVRIGWND